MNEKEKTILLVEPYFTGSHAEWAKGYRRFSNYRVNLLTLPGKFWKWRMHGGAISLAKKVQQYHQQPDLILCTDMLDLTTFLAYTRRQTYDVATAVYFHENQLTYPWQLNDRDVKHQRDRHYGFINYVTALVSDMTCFNSTYHYQSFVGELERFINHFPDFRETESIEDIRKKSKICALGLDLEKLDSFRVPSIPEPLILWNHRWEYDKNPIDFFDALIALAQKGIDFKVAVLGESFSNQPQVFDRAKQILSDRIVHWGYIQDEAEYARWLWRADILPVTSIQEFFGASVVQAIYCNGYPLLPKRLSYPELVSPQRYSEHFYSDQSEFIEKLAAAIQRAKELNTDRLRSAVKRFDWRRLAAEYDTLFSRLIALHKKRKNRI